MRGVYGRPPCLERAPQAFPSRPCRIHLVYLRGGVANRQRLKSQRELRLPARDARVVAGQLRQLLQAVPGASRDDDVSVWLICWSEAQDMELPVTVDRANPTRIEVKWEQVPSVTERRRQSAEAAAAEMRSTDQF